MEKLYDFCKKEESKYNNDNNDNKNWAQTPSSSYATRHLKMSEKNGIIINSWQKGQ